MYVAAYMYQDVLFNVKVLRKAQNFKYGETFSEDILQEILENCAPRIFLESVFWVESLFAI